MQGVRDQERTHGECRTSQNWIGSKGATLNNARFVPPPAHAQFETTHPFLDGNGRVGRRLIIFMLVEAKVLAKPLLYLSVFLNEHRSEYHDRLTAVRSKGDWEGWVKFFLRGISENAKLANDTGAKIIKLREQHRNMLSKNMHGIALLDSLFDRPHLDIKRACEVMQ